MSNNLHIEHVEVRHYREGDHRSIGFWLFDDLTTVPVLDFEREEDVPVAIDAIVAHCRAAGLADALDLLRQFADAGRGLHINGGPVGNGDLRAALAAGEPAEGAAA